MKNAAHHRLYMVNLKHTCAHKPEPIGSQCAVLKWVVNMCSSDGTPLLQDQHPKEKSAEYQPVSDLPDLFCDTGNFRNKVSFIKHGTG